MEVPRKSLELGRDSLLFRGPFVWNCLNKTPRECENIDEFKSVLKTSSNITALQKMSFSKGTCMNNNKDLETSFIAFDVVEFYPSISIDLLSAALDFASKHDAISDDERHIILQAKRSLLYNSEEPWSKKTSSNLFDVTMGSYDGAESCELFSAYRLHSMKDKFVNACNFGLYRDDGLGITKASPRKTELIKTELCSIFGKFGLKITCNRGQ